MKKENNQSIGLKTENQDKGLKKSVESCMVFKMSLIHTERKQMIEILNNLLTNLEIDIHFPDNVPNDSIDFLFNELNECKFHTDHLDYLLKDTLFDSESIKHDMENGGGVRFSLCNDIIEDYTKSIIITYPLDRTQKYAEKVFSEIVKTYPDTLILTLEVETNKINMQNIKGASVLQNINGKVENHSYLINSDYILFCVGKFYEDYPILFDHVRYYSDLIEWENEKIRLKFFESMRERIKNKLSLCDTLKTSITDIEKNIKDTENYISILKGHLDMRVYKHM